MPRRADHVMKPGKGDALSIRKVHQTDDDRKEQYESFRERKKVEQEHKEKRFARFRRRRKNKPSGGSGGGINIEVTSDS